MRVKVLYFATLRQSAGVKEESLELPDGSDLAALVRAVEALHPTLIPALPTAVRAVNREFAELGQRLNDGDVVALFPPVSGGAAGPTLTQLTEGELDLDGLLADLSLPTTGAVVIFSGVVRAKTRRGDPHETVSLEYQAYAEMAHDKMRQVADEIRRHWPAVEGIGIVQRTGTLVPGTPTVAIVCTAPHRDEGVFEAARYGIDRLKEIVPVWKKETGPGGEHWVEGDYHPSPKDRTA